MPDDDELPSDDQACNGEIRPQQFPDNGEVSSDVQKGDHETRPQEKPDDAEFRLRNKKTIKLFIKRIKSPAAKSSFWASWRYFAIEKEDLQSLNLYRSHD